MYRLDEKAMGRLIETLVCLQRRTRRPADAWTILDNVGAGEWR
jgi:hypothetical protein